MMDVNLTEAEYDELKQQIWSNLLTNAQHAKKVGIDNLDEIELKAAIKGDLMTAEFAHLVRSI